MQVCVCVRVCVPGGVDVRVYVTLLIQHANPMRHIVTSFVASLGPTYFSTISDKHDFRKEVIEHKMCFDFLYSFFLKYFSL